MAENEIRVDADGHIEAIGSRANALLWATDWVTGEPMLEVFQRLSTNPNYGPGDHPMWINVKSDGMVSLLPAKLEDGEEPDVMLIIASELDRLEAALAQEDAS